MSYGHQREPIAVLVTVRLEDHVVKLVPEPHLVLDDRAEATHVLGHDGGIGRLGLGSLLADLDDVQIGRHLVFPVVKQYAGDQKTRGGGPVRGAGGNEVAGVLAGPARAQQDLESAILADGEIGSVQRPGYHASARHELGKAAGVSGIVGVCLKDEVLRRLWADEPAGYPITLRAVDRRRQV
ncbi:hypothetical protein [Mycobacterium marinum]|uniref:hypothetical protein n=1 Tax=Mycobacterium marinum TaxID=1781 RepID=UPI0020CFE8AA|nr:hypothetical protein [Mycobacterium marinum]